MWKCCLMCIQRIEGAVKIGGKVNKFELLNDMSSGCSFNSCAFMVLVLLLLVEMVHNWSVFFCFGSETWASMANIENTFTCNIQGLLAPPSRSYVSTPNACPIHLSKGIAFSAGSLYLESHPISKF